MKYRTLGRTGIKVSPYCLGAMMFGAIGNPDHDDSVRIIHKALDAGINFVDTADAYSRGESEEIVGKALKGRRDDVVLATKAHLPMGDDPNQRGNSRRWLVRALEDSLQPARNRPRRPVPDPPARPGHRRGGDPLGPHRPGARGQGPGHRHLLLPRLGPRRGAVGRRATGPDAVPQRAADVLDPQPRHRARGAARLRALRHGRPGLQPARGRPADRPLPQGPPGRQPPCRLRLQAPQRRTAGSTSSNSSSPWPRRRGCR